MVNTVVKKVYVLDGGELELDASVMVSLNRPGERIRIPVQYFLVETTRGFVLVDTGNDPDVIDDAEGTWGIPLAQAATPIMEKRNHPLEQIKLVGLDASDIDQQILHCAQKKLPSVKTGVCFLFHGHADDRLAAAAIAMDSGARSYEVTLPGMNFHRGEIGSRATGCAASCADQLASPALPGEIAGHGHRHAVTPVARCIAVKPATAADRPAAAREIQ